MQSEQGSTPSTTAAAVQSINILNTSLGTQQQTGVRPGGQTAGPSMDTEMRRSFPGFFKKRPSRSAAFKSPKQLKLWKPFNLTVFLMHLNTTTTPSPEEDLQHLQAGLGKRTLSIDGEMTHAEISSLFEDIFPKIKAVSGGWLLYKAAGGNGRRHLSVVPPETEGYTASTLKTASGGGKTILYILPLQDELDLAPLSTDAVEFARMPKAECRTCHKVMPLQLLALHVTQCQNSTISDTDDYVECVSDDEPEPTQACCPICSEMFATQELESHASSCGLESPVNCQPNLERLPAATGPQEDETCRQLSSETDVLEWLVGQVDHTKEFRVCVTRQNVLQRGLLQWQRQKKGSPANPLKITYIGEAGIDTGALRKEFLTEMVRGIEVKMFTGDSKGKSPIYSVSDLESGFYRTAGEIFAVSLAQGGPPPCFLRSWCFDFISSGELKTLTKAEVDDVEYASLIERVEGAADFGDLTDDIINCGYTGALTMDRKDAIIRAIVLHATLHLTPILQQLRSGLKIYDFLKVIERQPLLCAPLFVPKQDDDDDDALDADYIMSIVVPHMSVKGSMRHTKETEILNFLQDFLQELQDKEHELPATSERTRTRKGSHQSAVSTPKQRQTQANPDAKASVSEDSTECTVEGTDETHLARQLVCQACERTGDDLLVCEAACGGSFHLECLGRLHTGEEKPMCAQCCSDARLKSLSIPMLLQWLTGQQHKPLLPSARADFKVHVKFEHNCMENMPGHSICYPVVNACSNTVRLPVIHMSTFAEFKDVLCVAVCMGADFGRV
ncbi:uncharacterized protein zgc:112970 [Engraulis encrasicolus]|uniref:uncharacterized protein zgc:112970 n=1 Tax=Engraulis encrasicolus TaxID=184585 RepID=UPI002FCF08EE